jgi:hypothetical protein
MGFVKRGEFEALKEEVARIKMTTSGVAKNAPKKSVKKAAPKKTAKKSPVKKASK